MQQVHDKIIDLSKQLIAIDSRPGNLKKLEKVLSIAVAPLKEFTIERFERNGSKSLLIHNRSKRPDRFKILLNGHLDIIPGKPEQYRPKIKGKRLYGVGALDMKSNLSVLIYVFKQLANKVDYPLALQIVTDEEVGGFDGTKYQIEQGVNSDFVISGETTNFNIVNKAKGILLLKITSSGKSAHGAYPSRGENAIWKMNTFLNTLRENFPISKKVEWKTTINLSSIKTTNTAFNKVPDDCEINLDIRFIPEDKDKIISSIENLLPQDFEMEVLIQEPSLSVDDKNRYIKSMKESVKRVLGKNAICYGAQGSSDARHYALINTPGVEFGAIGGGIGEDKEWIDTKSLKDYYNVLCDFLESLSS